MRQLIQLLVADVHASPVQRVIAAEIDACKTEHAL